MGSPPIIELLGQKKPGETVQQYAERMADPSETMWLDSVLAISAALAVHLKVFSMDLDGVPHPTLNLMIETTACADGNRPTLHLVHHDEHWIFLKPMLERSRAVTVQFTPEQLHRIAVNRAAALAIRQKKLLETSMATADEDDFEVIEPFRSICVCCFF